MTPRLHVSLSEKDGDEGVSTGPTDVWALPFKQSTGAEAYRIEDMSLFG